ncbi:MAG: biotin/lipoyl-binding protein [Anaerolineaceae bacterium]|jgi:biotin carboxyl carrier protein|nr:biotin/lipoyl-binding protein [Anaerolineaceae bacterium]MDD4043042.1 biotin/lipoyl-binding protein [Anaerolineaceae bacterium]MDD4577280.1 biotin/lipoyl-binding protein [Anaerolineaceae bacterium]
MKVNLTIEGKQYQVTLNDLNARPIIAEVDGRTYEVWPEDEQASTPANSSSASTPVAPVTPAPVPVAAGSQTLNAPLPGVIVSIEVKEGQGVSIGQELYVLEAMKMKNSIKADRNGKIASIHVNPGDLVKHNQPIMTFEG